MEKSNLTCGDSHTRIFFNQIFVGLLILPKEMETETSVRKRMLIIVMRDNDDDKLDESSSAEDNHLYYFLTHQS